MTTRDHQYRSSLGQPAQETIIDAHDPFEPDNSLPSGELDPSVLATFAPSLAHVVVDVLNDHDIPSDAEPRGGEYAVLVPPRRREEALGVLSRQMDEVQRRAEKEQPYASGPDDQMYMPPQTEFEEPRRPLITERFRNMAFLITVAIVPLLVLTLSRVPISMSVMLGVMAVTAVVLFYLRHLRRKR